MQQSLLLGPAGLPGFAFRSCGGSRHLAQQPGVRKHCLRSPGHGTGLIRAAGEEEEERRKEAGQSLLLGFVGPCRYS